MRIVPFIVSTIVTVGLVWALNKPWGDKVPMPLGKFLSPQHGFWQNAEDFSLERGHEYASYIINLISHTKITY